MTWKQREQVRREKEGRKRRKRENKQKTESIARYFKQSGTVELPNNEVDYISFCKEHGIVGHGFNLPYSEVTCECRNLSAPSKNIKKSAVIHFRIESSKYGKMVACTSSSELGGFTSDISQVGCGNCRQRLRMALKLSKEMTA